jgi:hypothetical protein
MPDNEYGVTSYDRPGSDPGHAPGYGYDLSVNIERNPLVAVMQKVRGSKILRSPYAEACIGNRYPDGFGRFEHEGPDLEPLYVAHRHKDALEPIRGTPSGR